MTDEQLLEMQDAGFEIGSHSLTHPFFTNLSNKEIIKELEESKFYLEGKGLNITSFAFPFSAYNEEILLEANKYYDVVRENYLFNSGGYIYNAQPVHSESDVDKICDMIKDAKAKNKWLILVFHGVKETPSFWDVSKEDFIKILECVEKKT